MSKIIYVLDDNKITDYQYNIDEDTIIYHFSINSTSNVNINMTKENCRLDYYYSNINYNDNTFTIKVNHLVGNTHSELYNHGVNVFDNKLSYYVDGIVPKDSFKCICNQENQIINMKDGKSIICPNLLIDNFDVDSNHAAYIGCLNEEDLFYMMSRGLSRETSNRLLINGLLLYSDSLEYDKIREFVDEIKNI